ncbi:MAG: T9SS type A sorting domain-containing protein [Ignavibacteria bacterium]
MYILLLFVTLFFLGWGSAGHKIINRKSRLSFPSVMNPFLWFPDSMAFHGSDADYRKSSDPTEEYRHYIDIEYYPEFLATGRIPQNWDSLVALHGINFVIDNGYVPFAIIAYTDSVKKYFQLHDWRNAMLRASDLGHYVADAYNPLHCTRYYNGWFYNSISYGIHSRYETQLINRDTAYIQYSGENVSFVNDINNFAFNIVYSSNSYRDSVYRTDSIAQVISGSNYSQLYYQNFWNLAGNFTIQFFKNASYKLMCLIYTAWVNAGSPIFVSNGNSIVEDFKLYQNYPNPFNNSSKIKYQISKSSDVRIIIYDIRGNEIFTIVNGFKKAGEYEAYINGSNLASSVYFYKLYLDNNPVETKKMILTK